MNAGAEEWMMFIDGVKLCFYHYKLLDTFTDDRIIYNVMHSFVLLSSTYGYNTINK